MFIGIDDTDSREGMCTTYLCTLIIRELRGVATLVGLPRIVRLNPNIPYKTRGNGALGFEVDGDPDEVWDVVTTLVAATSMKGENTNPGAVMLRCSDVPPELTAFYHRALHEEVGIDEAKSLAYELGAAMYYAGTGRGLIGALASVGADLGMHTYELIAYRELNAIGTPRYVNADDVRRIEAKYSPRIFDSYDWKNDYVAIAPKAPCPVLFGLRGTEKDVLVEAAAQLRTEPVAMAQLFITNQATDAHIQHMPIGRVSQYRSARVEGTVSERPHYEHKGHLFFSCSDGCDTIICAAYEPTKEFRSVVAQLVPGDRIAAYGGIKNTSYGLTLNLEKMEVLELASVREPVVPKCCDFSMKSVGAGKGYRCKRCGAKRGQDTIDYLDVPRTINLGWYEVPVIARRHLSRPLALTAQDTAHADG
jgi:tRNA(Ile2)-agmatinylcytidine synthase